MWISNIHFLIMDLRWESQGYFKPNFERGSETFVIPMPPPNVTGSLHMGHAMFVTLEVGKDWCIWSTTTFLFPIPCFIFSSVSLCFHIQLIRTPLWVVMSLNMFPRSPFYTSKFVILWFYFHVEVTCTSILGVMCVWDFSVFMLFGFFSWEFRHVPSGSHNN